MPFSLRLIAVCVHMLMWGVAYAQKAGTATAFVVAPEMLVTNHHVIEGCGAIEIITADGRRRATVVDSVERFDLALLRVDGLKGSVALLRTRSSVLLGESASIFGFPSGSGKFSVGVVSGLLSPRGVADEVQVTTPADSGNSGGPILDNAGLVIGVVKQVLIRRYTQQTTGTQPQNQILAASLNVLEGFLTKNNVLFNSVAGQAPLDAMRVAEMAQTFTYKISCVAAPGSVREQRPSVSNRLVQEIQVALNQKGFNVGSADGFIGSQTQEQIRAVQDVLRHQVNGIPSERLLAAIKGLNAEATDPSLGEARIAYTRKDYLTAAAIYRELAQNGNREAQFNLGMMYSRGLGVAQNYPEALKWYKLSAIQGDSESQLHLGQLYKMGRGAAQDYPEAVKLFKVAAAQGNSDAQRFLGFMYANGEGVIQDYAEALNWYKISAAQGNSVSQNNLGVMYKQGRGVAQDDAEALKLFQLAAAQGFAAGQQNLDKLKKELGIK